MSKMSKEYHLFFKVSFCFRITNICFPVQLLLIHVLQSMFYKSSPVLILQYYQIVTLSLMLTSPSPEDLAYFVRQSKFKFDKGGFEPY